MAGFDVLTYGAYAGLVFIFLWITATCSKEGLWENAVTFFCWVAGAALVSPFVPLLSGAIYGSIAEAGKVDFYLLFAISFAITWLLLIIGFVLVRMATDYLSPVKVSFHPVVDKIGGYFFALCIYGFIGTVAELSLEFLALAKLNAAVPLSF
jgi:hypothetical protein